MLESMKNMLEKAKEGKYAVGQFNIITLELTQAALLAAQEESSPIILGVTEGGAKHMGGFKVVVAMVKAFIEELKITVPVAIHLDHGSSFEACVKAIHAGFTSVMIDGSHYPLEENIAISKKVTDVAHAVGVSVEAELGRVGGQEDDLSVEDFEATYAVPSECDIFVKETGVDFLAPALGSVHGPYKGEPHLGFEKMEEIKNLANIPLVLHGGTGIPDADLKRAISCGTAKINVDTENRMALVNKIKEVLAEKPGEYDPRKYLGPARDAVKDGIKAKMKVFGCSGKA
ncbi:MAG TPA: fructose-1,6-bisphosphate aldolase, class II [Clostridiales bacterium]|nr:MAG: fructose-1,6-bisphosphate aldolase, class II [Clostridiales bacterium GWD2_32_59]HAN10353.1 fructose-1,6-bisphosphate aldolase, class II [Clostridiales bacterium]